jgi:hypothetical protein
MVYEVQGCGMKNWRATSNLSPEVERLSYSLEFLRLNYYLYGVSCMHKLLELSQVKPLTLPCGIMTASVLLSILKMNLDEVTLLPRALHLDPIKIQDTHSYQGTN